MKDGEIRWRKRREKDKNKMKEKGEKLRMERVQVAEKWKMQRKDEGCREKIKVPEKR